MRDFERLRLPRLAKRDELLGAAGSLWTRRVVAGGRRVGCWLPSATRQDANGRLRWKLRMVRHLYERGFERRDVEQLFRFIDWLMALPEELEEQFDVELRQLEGETKMPYVTPFERRAIERGQQQGVASVLKRLLMRRFEQLPEWAEERLDKASRDELEHWADRVIDAESLEQVFAAS